MSRFDLSQRASGVLLHLTSLPGPHGCGDLGAAAREFADFLQRSGQRWWQMLPVGPVGFGNSPYSAQSAFAGSPLLISLEGLVDDGLLELSAVRGRLPGRRVDYAATSAFREQRLRAAYRTFVRRPGRYRRRFQAFCERHARWLEDLVLFRALKAAHHQRAWLEWPPALAQRDRRALSQGRRELADELSFHRFEQWLFDLQWRRFREACASRGVGLIGDVPIFVAHDSADVWAHRELFQLDDEGRPTVIAGVPPDYFSASGQRWGNPLYRWDVLKRRGYGWWVDRLAHTLERFDAVRLDHFIGFQRYWEIPASEPNAVRGRWRPGPGADFFTKVRDTLGSLPLIAEDLGAVTTEVKALRDQFAFPGLRILQFAFGNDPSAPDFLPYNYPRRTVAYTGTHDNDTAVGWFNDPGDQGTRSRAQIAKERKYALTYVGGDGSQIHWDLLRTIQLSVANLAIAPVQDLLGLGSDARLNRPGTAEGNWEWRLAGRSLPAALARRLAELTGCAGRLVSNDLRTTKKARQSP